MVPSFPPAPSPRAIAATLLLTGLLAAACGSGASAPAAPAQAPPAAPATSAQGQGGSDPGSAGQSGQGGQAQGGQAQGGQQGSGASVVLPPGTKIVYRGTLSLEVTDVDAAVRSARQVVAELGGYLSGSRHSRDGGRAVASVTYRIPADRWEDALETLRSLGTIAGEETDAEEVTGQLVDLEARIRNLRASEAAIQRLTEDVTAVDEVLMVESRLTDLRGQIEQLDAQLASLTDKAALGTLTVTFGTAVTAIIEPVEEAGWDAGRDVSEATSTLLGVLQRLTSAGIWFGIVWVPVLLGLAILTLLGRYLLRRSGVLNGVARPSIPEA